MVKIYQIRGKKKKNIEEIKLDGISIYVTFKCLISLVRFYSNPSTIIHFHAQKSIQKRNDCSPCCIRNMFNHFEFLISIKMEKYRNSRRKIKMWLIPWRKKRETRAKLASFQSGCLFYRKCHDHQLAHSVSFVAWQNISIGSFGLSHFKLTILTPNPNFPH